MFSETAVLPWDTFQFSLLILGVTIDISPFFIFTYLSELPTPAAAGSQWPLSLGWRSDVILDALVPPPPPSIPQFLYVWNIGVACAPMPAFFFYFAFFCSQGAATLVRELLTSQSTSPVLDSRPSCPAACWMFYFQVLLVWLNMCKSQTPHVISTKLLLPCPLLTQLEADSASHVLASMPSTPPSR